MWLINLPFLYLRLPTNAIELPSVNDLRNVCRCRAESLKEEMKQHPSKSEVPAIARLLSLGAKLFAP